MEIYKQFESIECLAAYIECKKPQASSPLKHEIFGRCLKYICTRDCIAEIKKELLPKDSKLNNSIAYLNLGDRLKCKSMYVLKRGLKPINFKKTPFSGRHNCRAGTTDDYTFAEIIKPFEGAERYVIELPKDYKRPTLDLR